MQQYIECVCICMCTCICKTRIVWEYNAVTSFTATYWIRTCMYIYTYMTNMIFGEMYRVAKMNGCLKMQVSFRKRAINYRAFLRKMTSKDKASYGSCGSHTHTRTHTHTLERCSPICMHMFMLYVLYIRWGYVFRKSPIKQTIFCKRNLQKSPIH